MGSASDVALSICDTRASPRRLRISASRHPPPATRRASFSIREGLAIRHQDSRTSNPQSPVCLAMGVRTPCGEQRLGPGRYLRLAVPARSSQAGHYSLAHAGWPPPH